MKLCWRTKALLGWGFFFLHWSAAIERDIRQLFRDKDVEEMRFAFDLTLYEDVKTNAAAILDRISDGSMPCDFPWSSDQIAQFSRWMEEGFLP